MPLITEEAGARELAKRVGATIVIYGNIYVQGTEAKLTPRFFVSPDLDASELTGENELAKPIIFNVSTLDQQEVVEQDLKAKAAILGNFTEGLIRLSNNDLDNAETSVQTAIKIAETSTEPFPGKESLYLLAAHIETGQKNYDLANQLLDQAFQLNPNYARAHIARGNIDYDAATQSRPVAEALLEKALAEYQAAYQEQDQPPGANIPTKAHMAIGNIYFLQAQIAGDKPELYLKAIENYSFVTDQYEKSKDSSLRKRLKTGEKREGRDILRDN